MKPMRKKWRICLAALAVVCCTLGMEIFTPAAAAAEEAVPSSGSGSGRYNFEQIKVVPELADLHLREAMDHSVHRHMDWLNMDEEHYIDPVYGSSELDSLVSFAWYSYYEDTRSAFSYLSFGGDRYSVPHSELVEMIEDVFVGDKLPKLIKKLYAYNEETDSYRMYLNTNSYPTSLTGPHALYDFGKTV